MRIPNKFLEHRVSVEALQPVGSSVGARYDDAVVRPAIVVDKRSRVSDQREGATKGEEILTSSHVLLQPEHIVPPGSLVTIWVGTPQERKGTVVATALGRHSKAPESAQLWLT